jgi:GntR family L-lactate dehydrogenase operon transcriptional regulator
MLASNGLDASEPSVGRALRRLDRSGFTERVSNRGRVLTPRGISYAHALLAQDERSKLEDRVLEVMRPRTVSALVDLLVVRRALEREAARLAAESASPAQVADLESQVAAPGDPIPGAFHESIARATGNQVLIAILSLISNEQVHTRMRAILEEAGHGRSDRSFSIRMLEAIKRRDPERAEGVMDEHFESMLAALDQQTSAPVDEAHANSQRRLRLPANARRTRS